MPHLNTKFSNAFQASSTAWVSPLIWNRDTHLKSVAIPILKLGTGEVTRGSVKTRRRSERIWRQVASSSKTRLRHVTAHSTTGHATAVERSAQRGADHGRRRRLLLLRRGALGVRSGRGSVWRVNRVRRLGTPRFHAGEGARRRGRRRTGAFHAVQREWERESRWGFPLSAA